MKAAAQMTWGITALLAIGLAPWMSRADRSWLGGVAALSLAVAVTTSWWSAWRYLRPRRAPRP